jgi:hypothetical protein
MRDLLPAVLARLARESGQAERLLPVWAEIVGPQISRNARPRRLEGGALVIEVTAARWAQELGLQQATLCERLNGQLGRGAVQRLEFVPEGTRR